MSNYKSKIRCKTGSVNKYLELYCRNQRTSHIKGGKSFGKKRIGELDIVECGHTPDRETGKRVWHTMPPSIITYFIHIRIFTYVGI